MASERFGQFVEDMEDAGYEVRDYKGRGYYEGPAVVVPAEELQDVIRATTVRLQTDQMGKDKLVVYPA